MGFEIHLPILINVLGHSLGVTAFGAFLLLLRTTGVRGHGVWLPATAAGIALCWNAGALIVLLSPTGSALAVAVAAFSFAVLSLLPCTLLALALGGERKWLSWTGLGVGVIAAISHLLHPLRIAPLSHDAAIAVINVGFIALSVIAAGLLALGGQARHRRGTRMLAAMALFLFAAGFVHFGSEHGPTAWEHEFLFHHAGIPLALFVLMQDYRFLLVDAFARLAGTGLLAIMGAASLLALAHALGLLDSVDGRSGAVALFLASGSLLLISYPRAIRWLDLRLQGFLFRRNDANEAVGRIRSLPAESEDDLAKSMAEIIARFVSANHWELLPAVGAEGLKKVEIAPSPYFDELRPPNVYWAAAAVPLRVGQGVAYLLLLGSREGGRRYLSGDIADLEDLADEAANRIDRQRAEEQQQLLRDAEIDTLRAQINPHFLFNSLHALNGIIPPNAQKARKTLLNLADIFRYALDAKRQFVPLEDEIRIVEAYLQIERLRLGERLQTNVSIDQGALDRLVPALAIQPLVENSVKHGISPKPEGGEVGLTVRMDGDGLSIQVCDSGSGFDPDEGMTRGHGLTSVRRRLQLSYSESLDFQIESGSDGTKVSYRIPARLSSND